MSLKKKKTETVRLSITSLAPTGEGVAHVDRSGDRRAVFVPRSAPGDELEVLVDFSQRPARGQLRSVITASVDRVTPACEVADRCGGCDYMHLTHEAQIAARVGHVREALPAGSRVDVVAADKLEGYRTRARLHVRASGGRAIVGFFAAESHAPIETRTCLVLHPLLDAARAVIASLLEGASGEGEARLALGAFEARRPVLDISWPRELPAQVYARVEKCVTDQTLGGVRITCGESSRPAVVGDPTPWIEGADGLPLELGPTGFAQASEDMNGKLARAVAHAVGDSERVLELYAGAGNFTVLLAKRATKLIAVDLDESSCEASRRNLARRSLRATVVAADASHYELPRAVDTLVLDPPRTGATHIAQALAKSTIKRVVYVSCDTRTLARDLTTLAPNYEVGPATLFEMFPHVSHCETLVVLTKRRK